jgi:hypothetical protein
MATCEGDWVVTVGRVTVGFSTARQPSCADALIGIRRSLSFLRLAPVIEERFAKRVGLSHFPSPRLAKRLCAPDARSSEREGCGPLACTKIDRVVSSEAFIASAPHPPSGLPEWLQTQARTHGAAYSYNRATVAIGISRTLVAEIMPLQAGSRLTACLRLSSQMVLGTGWPGFADALSNRYRYGRMYCRHVRTEDVGS